MINYQIKLHPSNTHGAVMDFITRIKTPSPIKLFYVTTYDSNISVMINSNASVESLKFNLKIPPQ